MLTDVGESISSVTIYNIVNQLDKHDPCCGAVKNNLKDRKRFLIKRIEILLTQFLLGMAGIVPPCRI